MVFHRRAAALTGCTPYFFGVFLRIRVYTTYALVHSHTPCPPAASWLECRNTAYSVRALWEKRKWSCDRRDCEAGCWRFICSGGAAEVTGVKLLHLLATTVLKALVEGDKETSVRWFVKYYLTLRSNLQRAWICFKGCWGRKIHFRDPIRSHCR